MAYYDQPKEERAALNAHIKEQLQAAVAAADTIAALPFFSDEDTYIRKAAYLALGRVYAAVPELQDGVLRLLRRLETHEDYRVRQTVINAAGEIGKTVFERVQSFFDKGLPDAHHSPRNAVIGSIKKMGEVNPKPVLAWAATYLHHPDKEIRREICHGIELRGRKYPQDILPLLQQLEHDSAARVRNTLVHVLGQIAYKKGCLEMVTAHLAHWENRELVRKALEEIIDVHYRYRNFSHYTQDEASAYITAHFRDLI